MNYYTPNKTSSLVKAFGIKKVDGFFCDVDLVFKDARYRYYRVPYTKVVSLLNSKSLGKTYNTLIKGRFRQKKLPLPKEFKNVVEVTMVAE